MKVNPQFLLTNPFFEAYWHSDFLGKGIIIALFLLSIGTWILLVHKTWMTSRARKSSMRFHEVFQKQKFEPLGIHFGDLFKKNPNPYRELYSVLKKHTLDILNKNRLFSHQKSPDEVSYLSSSDIEFLDTLLYSTISMQAKLLEKHLFILSTIVTLGPFLGLLGTVWGILTTFSELQVSAGGATNQMVIGGLSLALATTVLGLLDAIPALIGYNYLKNTIRDFQTEMEGFSTEILASVEMQYRKVDIHS